MSSAFATIDKSEIEKFSAVANTWWDINGSFAPLHRLNPVRLSYLRQQIIQHFSLDPNELRPFSELKILDIGCGGGLTAEPMARLGAIVTAVDADEVAIGVAKSHAEDASLAIDYRCETTATLKDQFDVVLALEIVEHVADVMAFTAELKRLLKPGGILIMSTLNRSPKSFLLGIVAAEYLLRWVPRGTHNWKRFLKPSELGKFLGQQGFKLTDITGMIYDPLTRQFSLNERDLSVNYLLTALPV